MQGPCAIIILISVLFVFGGNILSQDVPAESLLVQQPEDPADNRHYSVKTAEHQPLRLVKDGRIFGQMPRSKAWVALFSDTPGAMTLRGVVNSAGYLDTAYVMSSSGFSWLDTAALAAARASSFTPATNMKGEKTSALIEWDVLTGGYTEQPANPTSGHNDNDGGVPEPEEFVEADSRPEPNNRSIEPVGMIAKKYVMPKDTVPHPFRVVKDSTSPDHPSRAKYYVAPESSSERDTVTLRGKVGVDGTFSYVYVAKASGNPQFDTAALIAARECEFYPAADLRGDPVEALLEWTETGESFPASDEIILVENQPEMIYQEKPGYPSKAKEAGLSGTVWVQALVGKDGRVLDARVGKSCGTASLDEAAVKAAFHYKYKPAVQNGKPVAIWVTYEVKFSMEE